VKISGQLVLDPVQRFDEQVDALVGVIAPQIEEVTAGTLRDVARNPEWRFVREGPTWQGRRVATWAELVA